MTATLSLCRSLTRCTFNQLCSNKTFYCNTHAQAQLLLHGLLEIDYTPILNKMTTTADCTAPNACIPVSKKRPERRIVNTCTKSAHSHTLSSTFIASEANRQYGSMLQCYASKQQTVSCVCILLFFLFGV